MSLLERRIPGRPYLIAHRGNSAELPENSLPAFRRAVEDGADIVETDVRVSADGVFVLIHDPTLERTTDGSGRVEAQTFAQLRERRLLGNPDGMHRIPTLEEMAEAIPPPVVLALELKAREFRSEEICRTLAAEIVRLGIADRSLILSAYRRHLEAWRSAAPEIPVGLVSWGAPFPPRGVELLGPPWPVLALNPLYVWMAHRRGQLVCPLDPHPDGRLAWYLRAGCDAVLSDAPGVTRERIAACRRSSSAMTS